MKILAVRGRNLASLMGPFAVEFDRPPLDRAGLFAITGPTAAGKSTLLDAICLALFDEVPRLQAAPRHDVGREGEGVKANDVKSLLSRGTSEGFAAVEFLGRDGNRYLARWEVWRANGNPDGKLQGPTMSIKDAESGLAAPGSGTKTETLAAIEGLVGLSFAQFCRSALLAQGDFAAFLRAVPDDRAALLEQMTGTEIYSRLSRRAHELASAEKKALEDLALKHGTVEVLPDDDRARVQAEHDAQAVRVVDAEAAQANASAALTWHAVRAERARLTQQARDDLAFAESARAASTDEARELAQVEAAQPLRPLVDAQVESLRTATEAAVTLAKAQRDHELAQSRATTARAAAAVAHGAAEDAEGALLAAKPRLVEARALEHELDRVGLDFTQAKRQAEASRTEAATAHGQAGLREEEQRRARSAQLEAKAWLGSHAEDEALASEWPRWRGELERAAKAAARLSELDRLRPGLEHTARSSADKRDAAGAATSSATEAVEACEVDALAARAAAEEAQARAPREGRASLLEERARLQTMERSAQDADAAGEEAEQQRGRAAEARAAADAASQAAKAAGARRSELAAQHVEESKSLEHARATRGLAAHRAALAEGEPCPLCGGLEHPYASALPPLDAMLHDLERRVGELGEEVARALQGQTTAEASQAEQARRATEADTAVAKAEEARLAHEARWREVRSQVGSPTPESPLAPDALARVQSLQSELATRLRSAEAAEADVARLLGLDKAATDRLDKARKALARAERERAALEAAASAAENALSLAAVEVSRWTVEERDALSAVAPVFPSEPDLAGTLRKGARAFVSTCERRVEDRRAHQKAQDDAERLLAGLGPEVVAALERARERAASAQAATDRRDALAASHTALVERLAALFGGRSSTQVERELEAAVAKGNAASSAAQASAARADIEEAARAATVAALLQTRDQRDRARDAAARALDDALSSCAWSRSVLETLLARDAAWLRTRRERLAGLDRAVTHAASVLSEREAQGAAHERTGPPALTETDARASLTAAATELAEAKAALETRTFALHKDDEARRRKATLEAETGDRRKAADVWLRLGALIGSENGKKLRVFAQGLTFETLLAHANHHMKVLRPRYRLQRVPGQDLNFQIVDLEQGEDIRSVNGLSGGETFLVSLALALGLSSLSSKDTRVESLFIDEGFGTLDPDSLGAALDALDALHATGRKVGVISHVPGLAEHIGVQVKVVKLGNGKSRIEVAGAPPVVEVAPSATTSPKPAKAKRGRPKRPINPSA